MGEIGFAWRDVPTNFLSDEQRSMQRNEWVTYLKQLKESGGYIVPDMPVQEHEEKDFSEFIVVYHAATGQDLDPELMRMDGALHLRQMIRDIEDFVAQQASRELASVEVHGNEPL